MSDYRFSLAGIADISRVAALIERAYRGATAAKGWTNESALLTGPRSSPEEIAALIRDPHSRFVLAVADGALAGCALLQKHEDGAYFGMFAIDPDRQGTGLGKEMMGHCEEAARVLWHAKYLRLAVISLRTELIAWYERRGFVLTGEREPFPFETAPGAVRRDFDLVILQKPL